MKTFGSCCTPLFSFRVASASASAKRSAMPRWQMTRLDAVQRWPLVKNALVSTS